MTALGLRRRYAGWRRANHDRRRRAASLSVVLLGDSITLECRNPLLDWWDRADAAAGFRFRPAVNAGVGGDTAAGLAARTSDVLAHAPDWCVVEVGGNDLAGGCPPADVAAGILEVHAALRQAGVLTIATEVLPSVRTPWSNTAETNRRLAASIEPLCRWADVLGTPEVDTRLARDGTHPGIAGVRAMASRMEPVIRELGKERRVR